MVVLLYQKRSVFFFALVLPFQTLLHVMEMSPLMLLLMLRFLML
jgi:hypothetical protein